MGHRSHKNLESKSTAVIVEEEQSQRECSLQRTVGGQGDNRGAKLKTNSRWKFTCETFALKWGWNQETLKTEGINGDDKFSLEKVKDVCTLNPLRWNEKGRWSN